MTEKAKAETKPNSAQEMADMLLEQAGKGDLPPDANSRFGAHWHIFVPTIVIAVLYFAGWLGLYMFNGAQTGLARLFIVVLAVGVPLLLAHAFIRYQTIFLEIYDDHFLVHTGWPKAEPIELPFQVVKGIKVRRGLSGRLFGGGTLFIQLISSDQVILADVRAPEEAIQRMNEALSKRA